jgi:hypothetical protein
MGGQEIKILIYNKNFTIRTLERRLSHDDELFGWLAGMADNEVRRR